MATGAMGHLPGATECEPLSMGLGSTAQMQRREFDKPLPDALSVFLRHMRWLMVGRKPTAMPDLGQGDSPVHRYTPSPPPTQGTREPGWGERRGPREH